ncbi:hypothetical protein Dimus_004800 [Dionaea muscipula]
MMALIQIYMFTSRVIEIAGIPTPGDLELSSYGGVVVDELWMTCDIPLGESTHSGFNQAFNHHPSHHDTETDLIREEEVADSTQDARNVPPPGDRSAQVAGENPPPITPQVVPAGGSAPNLTSDVIQLLFQQQQQMQTLMNVLIEQRGAPVGTGGTVHAPPMGTDTTPERRHHEVLIDKFLRMNPPKFYGSPDALEAEDWMLGMEKILEVFECTEA